MFGDKCLEKEVHMKKEKKMWDNESQKIEIILHFFIFVIISHKFKYFMGVFYLLKNKRLDNTKIFIQYLILKMIEAQYKIKNDGLDKLNTKKFLIH